MTEDDTINEDFFNFIDNPLKAYILGVVVFNNEEKDDTDNLNIVINLNNVKDNDNKQRSISYGYYKDLKDEEKKHYPYFNNIDTLVKHLSKLGNVKYAENTCLTGIIELTITSQKIKDNITTWLNVGSIHNIKDCDLTDFVTKCYNDDVNIFNQFVRAYIEKYASIIYDTINVTFYNEKLADIIIKLYDIPCNKQKNINNYVIQYNSVNMIDLLGMIYSNYECPYYNNYIYTYMIVNNNNNDNRQL
jgi:hypothetical protein